MRRDRDIGDEKMKRVEFKKLEDIAKVLQDNMSLEQMDFSPYRHGMYYFIHIREDDFSFSKNCGAGIQSFAVMYPGEIKDDSYDWETLDNEDFRATCEFLLKKINSYISEETK